MPELQNPFMPKPRRSHRAGIAEQATTAYVCVQIKSIWSVLLRGFEFELVDSFPEPDFESMVVGPKPCRVHYKRRKQPL